MPQVKMPDGTIVDMPDNPSPELLNRLRSFLDESGGDGVKPVQGDTSTTTTATTGPAPSARLKPVPGMLESEGMTQFLRQAALPMAGGLSGAPLGPLGIAGGSLAGEGLAQATGVSPRSNLQLGLSAVAPLIPGGAGLTGRFLRKFGSPTVSARTLNALAGPETENFIAKFAVQGKASALFKQSAAEGGRIPMRNTVKSIDELAETFKTGFKDPEIASDLKQLAEFINKNNGALNPEQMQTNLALVGKTLKKLEAEGGSPFGAANKIFDSMIDDLDYAVLKIPITAPGSSTLKLARDTFKRNKAIEDAIDISSMASKSLRGQGEFVQFNAPEVIRNLKKDRFFPKAFNPQEQKEIFGFLETMNKIPALRPGAGQQFGSGMVMKGLRAGGLMGGAGFAAGGATGGALGTAAGILGPPAAEVWRNFWIAASMKEGRQLLRNLIREKGLTSRGAAILGAFAASTLKDSPEQRQSHTLGIQEQ